MGPLRPRTPHPAPRRPKRFPGREVGEWRAGVVLQVRKPREAPALPPREGLGGPQAPRGSRKARLTRLQRGPGPPAGGAGAAGELGEKGGAPPPAASGAPLHAAAARARAPFGPGAGPPCLGCLCGPGRDLRPPAGLSLCPAGSLAPLALPGRAVRPPPGPGLERHLVGTGGVAAARGQARCSSAPGRELGRSRGEEGGETCEAGVRGGTSGSAPPESPKGAPREISAFSAVTAALPRAPRGEPREHPELRSYPFAPSLARGLPSAAQPSLAPARSRLWDPGP